MNIVSRSLIVALLLTLSCLLRAEPFPLMETDGEKVALARIYTVLKGLTELIAKAKSCQDKTKRIQFRYDALQQDIQQIKTGIDAMFHPPSIQPYTIPSIQGDYINFDRKTR